ncbi:DUF397 domain-containing protein [Streptomyces sp. NPDC047515]
MSTARRDSKRKSGPTLTFTPTRFTAFARFAETLDI